VKLLVAGGSVDYIAHENQSLKAHLTGVAKICREYAAVIGCADYGELLGYLHDSGKYSDSFQRYIRAAIKAKKEADKEFNPDDDEDFVDARGLKGKIDHSTAGAQFVWQKFSRGTKQEQFFAQVLSLCLVSHHSGLIDCLSNTSNGPIDTFSKRIGKSHERTYYKDVIAKAEIIEDIETIMNKPDFFKPFDNIINDIEKKNPQENICAFQEGLLVRFLFSCLVDADRQDSADSEKVKNIKIRQNNVYISWEELIQRLENHLISKFGESKTSIDGIRREISEQAFVAATREKGIFTLTVPTGGGKTLASLRFALHHAKKHTFTHIFYIIPFTTIIDQNAGITREILEIHPEEKGKIVLEHHSNIGAERQSWKEKLLTENWDAPVVFTTMVQFLEALFGGGTRGVRRMHQLANSLIIFDEIQTLPIKCVHLFCNAVNFLVDQCGSSVVLCTATQPLLGQVDAKKGALQLSEKNEIVSNVHELFQKLKRVDVKDYRRDNGWTDLEVAELVESCVQEHGSCLVVVNKKDSARTLYEAVKAKNIAECFHLTTAMCPAHRKDIIKVINERLHQKLPTICISTSLMECGVDISFGSAIRYVAGLDSIAQTCGRCNRHGETDAGVVYIINPANEDLSKLEDIKNGKQEAEEVLSDYKVNPEAYSCDQIGPELMGWYYENYFFRKDQRDKMDYPISKKEAGYREESILNLLASNEIITSQSQPSSLHLKQAFMTAGEWFKSIDAPTESIIVPYGEKGKEIINQLCAAFDVEKQYKLLQEVQQYSVNVYPQIIKILKDKKVLFRVQEDTEIYYLQETYYSDEFGVATEAVAKEGLLNV
jgi:CRISPR-associated endonuclease/helicase Cas3